LRDPGDKTCPGAVCAVSSMTRIVFLDPRTAI
jgi:hypothetical protein